MNGKDSYYIRFIEEALELCKKIPRYFSKYSNRIFCNHQKLVLLILKQKLKTTYRELIEILKISKIPLLIGLKRIPHHTTLVKFAKRIGSKLLEYLLPFKRAKIAGVDSTGFSVGVRSIHYLLRTKKRIYRRYIKLGLSADMQKLTILRYAINKGPRNDNKDFLKLIKDLDIDYLVADKAYSSKKNRNYILFKKKAIPIIPYKKTEGVFKFRDGKILKFDDNLYHQRSKIETIFSVIKRKFGSSLSSRSFIMQKKELIFRLVAYNIDRIVRNFLFLLEGFSKAKRG